MKKIMMGNGLVIIGDPSKIVTIDGKTKIMDVMAKFDFSLKKYDGQRFEAGELMRLYDEDNPNELEWELD